MEDLRLVNDMSLVSHERFKQLIGYKDRQVQRSSKLKNAKASLNSDLSMPKLNSY